MEKGKIPKEADFYRDWPGRLLGYFNEVGESFRPVIHVNWVRLSYAISSTYVLADTVDKALKMSKGTFENENMRNKKVMVQAADTLIWQAFASIIIPGYTINRICAGSYYLLKKSSKLPKGQRKWITTFIGLASIPFIIKPIDHLTEYAMDETFRKVVVVKS